jgi:predicted transcriptional regulator
MTTTAEVAVIETDDVEPEVISPLDKRQAKALDKKIRSQVDKVASARDKTLDLLEELSVLVQQAKDGQIHKALETSWSKWLSDAVQIEPRNREDRKMIAQFLYGEGMSQSAVAKTLGVSQKTIDRDVDDMEHEDGATVTSLDGKVRSKQGKGGHTAADDEDETEVIDAEVVEGEELEESEEPEYEPMTAVAIVESFAEETANLVASSNELKLLAQEDKWAGAKKRILKAGNLNNIQEVITELQAIVDDLMEA